MALGFLLVGGLLVYFFFVRPAMRILEARSWEPVSCTIVESRVQEHSGDDGSTYSVAVAFTYSWGGSEHRSDRYKFMGGSSSGYDSKAKIVAALPPGTRTTCWVNPEDPADAVVERGFTPDLLFGLIPLVFFLAGLTGVVSLASGSLVHKRSRLPGAAPAAGTMRLRGGAPAGPVALEPAAGPLGKLAGMSFVALFWNGIVALVFQEEIAAIRAGQVPGDILFFGIFGLIGVAMIGGVGYFFLAMFNPRPHLTLSSVSLQPGSSAQITWRFSGATRTIRRLQITLEGREEAVYRRGTDTHTDTEVFATLPIVDTTQSSEVAAGSTSFVVPFPTMHSFKAPNNQIGWKLKLLGEQDNWPDVSEDYDFIIRPKGAPEGWEP